MTESLRGTIERVTYHNPENGFAVLRVKPEGRPAEIITVVGTLTSVTAGEHLEASGRWVVDQNHGPQFKADHVQTMHPASLAGLERYLASGAIRSVGPKLAQQIVKLYGEQTLDVIEKHPDLLLHIHGIGRTRLQRIRQSWDEQREVRRIMLFLHDHGIGTAQAVKIYRAYGHEAIERIQQNPYCLANDIRGIGFRTADDIARRVGIDRNAPERLRAALHYMLQQLSAQGHVGYPQQGLLEATAELLDLESELLGPGLDYEVHERLLMRELIEGEPWVYLPPLYHAECGLAAAVGRLIAGEHPPLPGVDVEAALAEVEQKLGVELAEQQREAVRQGCRQAMLVVTGGPGVGKTTLIRSLVEIYQAAGRRVVLAAPTGRAAKRLSETTGQTAKTIHRLLEFDPASGGFSRDSKHPLSGDLFVLDESSMIDVVLGYQFLRAVPAGASVVFVGDVNQLPSVGPGSFLADLIASEMVPVVRLTKIFRQAAASRIVSAAHSINEGTLPELETPRDALTDFYFTECDEPDAIQSMMLRLIQQRIPQRFGLDPLADVQVLSPMNRGQLGVRNLNQALQEALNPARGSDGRGRPEVQRFGVTYRVGDRVIQTENNYQREVFNGDLGWIEKINELDQEVTIHFEGRRATYDFHDLDEVSLAYVISIHKSQGSEYPCVIIPLHTQHFLMLQRNLIYTGVTRGKQLVVLVGSQKALGLAIRRADSGHRYTALRKRLQELPA